MCIEFDPEGVLKFENRVFSANEVLEGLLILSLQNKHHGSLCKKRIIVLKKKKLF